MPATSKADLRTRRQDRARQQRQDAKARKACVEAVWARAGLVDGVGWAYCEKCGIPVKWGTRFTGLAGHVHEVKPRSLGGSPHDPANCKLLCAAICHPEAHRLYVGAHRRSVRASR